MDSNTESRIGLFGGSFDPVHNGHLEIARESLLQFKLDRVLFIPAAQSPLKEHSPRTCDKERIDMLELTVGGDELFEICLDEIERGGVSYSFETANSVQQRFPEAQLFWILGGDQAQQLGQWRNIKTLAKTVEFICLPRNGEELSNFSLPQEVHLHMLDIPLIKISSTQIRQSLKDSPDSNPLLPESVIEYIKSKNLYARPMTEGLQLTEQDLYLLELCCQAIDETKGEDIVILDVSKQSSITNFLILASANSEPHMRALKRDLDKTLKDHNVSVLGLDEGDESGWSVLDAFDVMIHLFTPAMRANYDLESLWKDARPIDVEALLTKDKKSA